MPTTSPPPPAPTETFATCDGCGGRNPVGGSECDWCGRSFVTKGGRLRLTAWQILSTLLLLALIGAVGALAYLNAGRPLQVRPSSPTVIAGPTLLPTPAVTPRVTPPPTATAEPVAEPTAVLRVGEVPVAAQAPTALAATPTPARQAVRIANTSGQGVSVRAQAGPQAPRLGALREGTLVQLTGEEQTIAARAWQEIETEDSAMKGWVMADFLQPAP